MLVYREIRGRTRGSFLGYGWIVLQPLLATGLYTVLVQYVLGVNPSSGVPYAVFIFSGMIVWSYFGNGLAAATDGVVANGDLLRQVNFPREVLVLNSFVGKLIDFAVSLFVLALLLLIYRVPIPLTFLIAPLFILPVLIFGYGLALLLSPLNVAVRDVGKALPLFLNFAVFATPVLYPVEKVPEQWRTAYLLNPVAASIEAFRNLAVYGRMPEMFTVASALAIAIAVFSMGQWLFDRFELAMGDIV